MQSTRLSIVQTVTAMCEKVLGSSVKIGESDDLLALGLHSLLTIRLLNQIRTTFQYSLPLATLMSSPTISSIAQQIESGSTELGDATNPTDTPDDMLYNVHEYLSIYDNAFPSHLQPIQSTETRQGPIKSVQVQFPLTFPQPSKFSFGAGRPCWLALLGFMEAMFSKSFYYQQTKPFQAAQSTPWSEHNKRLPSHPGNAFSKPFTQPRYQSFTSN